MKPKIYITTLITLCLALTFPCANIAQGLLFEDASATQTQNSGDFPYSTGTLVNDQGTIYFINQTTKIPFTNYQAFVGLGYSLNNVVNGSLKNYTMATTYAITSATQSHPWGSWLEYKGTIYYSHEVGLIGVPSMDVFLQNGGTLKNIVAANKADLEVKDSGSNLEVLQPNDDRVYKNTAVVLSSAHNPGELIVDNGTIYLITAGGRQGIPSMEVFNSWGYQLANVQQANSADKTLTVTGVLALKTQTTTDTPAQTQQPPQNQTPPPQTTTTPSSTPVVTQPNPAPITTPTPVSKGGRLLGIDITTTENNNFTEATSKAKELGSEVVSLSLNWDDIETSPGVYNNPNLAIANDFYSAQGLKVTLNVRAIDTNGRHTPSDLNNLSLDDTALISRYNTMIDYCLGQLNKVNLNALSLSNEVDPYLSSSGQWSNFGAFTFAVKNHVKATHPNLPVSFTAALPDLLGSHKTYYKALYQEMDAVFTTYYPLEADFSVQDPAVAITDIKNLVTEYSNKNIYFFEVGYPTSAVDNSSEEKQATFVKNIFSSWDTYKDRIPFISFTWLTDRSSSSVDGFAQYYQLSDAKFKEYLRSLGLRTYPGSGTDKLGFTALKTEAKARGW
ncbi:MAG: hypothetical protein HY918_03320 [Candidatus Doudnabacteria bacterium]|nr:hypothetical protein [Candidatus Doudnabacteria bacterium]